MPSIISWNSVRTLPTIVFVLALFVGLRLAVLVLLSGVVSGQEFTDDVAFFAILADRPWTILAGDISDFDNHVWNHPPLLGPLMWPMQPLLVASGEFIGPRLYYVLWEALALLLVATRIPSERRLATLLILALLPANWLTSVVFAQEEFIGGALLVGAALGLLSPPRPAWAASAGALAILGAKIFTAIPLLPLAPRLLGLAPRVVGITTLISAILGTIWVSNFIVNAGRLPLIGTTPAAPFSIAVAGAWGDRIGLKPLVLKYATAAAVMGFIIILLVIHRKRLQEATTALHLALVSGLFFTVVFYHSNPEYFAMLTPLFALVTAWHSQIVRLWGLYALATTAAWGVNICYGLIHAAGDGGAKGRLLALYQQWLPAWTLELGWSLALITVLLATLGILVIFLDPRCWQSDTKTLE